MSKPDFSGLKQVYTDSFKQILGRLDRLESQNKDLSQRLSDLEAKINGG